MGLKMWTLGHVHVLDVSSARMEMQKTSPEKDSFPVQTPRLSPFNTNSCCEEALYPVICSISMRGKTGKLFFPSTKLIRKCVHTRKYPCWPR